MTLLDFVYHVVVANKHFCDALSLGYVTLHRFHSLILFSLDRLHESLVHVVHLFLPLREIVVKALPVVTYLTLRQQLGVKDRRREFPQFLQTQHYNVRIKNSVLMAEGQIRLMGPEADQISSLP